MRPFFKHILVFGTLLPLLMSACNALQPQPAQTPGQTGELALTEAPQANLPNPASVYCKEQGNKLEIRDSADGSQNGVCMFPNGSECDEWAYFRGECTPSEPATQPADGSNVSSATDIPTIPPVDPSQYQGWWTYTHAAYGFSIMLPEDWVVEEITSFDPLMSGHTLNLHPKEMAPDVVASKENIRMTFRRVGEEFLLWPTGVGQGEFVPQGTLDIAGLPAQRLHLICPAGDVTSIWYHQADGQPNILRGNMEFGFIYSATSTHCEPGYSLSGKALRMGEMILASLRVP
jgi:putative hemolysin